MKLILFKGPIVNFKYLKVDSGFVFNMEKGFLINILAED